MKRKIYIILSMFLGILLAVIANALVEKAYIMNMLSHGAVPVSTWSVNCFLPLFLSIIFLIGGVALGYVLGVRWWQIVYEEKRHWRMKNK